MERYRISKPPENKIIAKYDFIVDEIYPICIQRIVNNNYGILFFAKQDSTEDTIFLQLVVGANTNYDILNLEKSELYITNISKYKHVVERYNETIDKVSKSNSYNTDFDLVPSEEHKQYFSFTGVRIANDNKNAVVLNGMITRDNFIKINIFMNRLMDFCSDYLDIFFDKKYRNIQFIKINHLKLDACTKSVEAPIVCSHYTCGLGPTQFKFNYSSVETQKMSRMRLRNMMMPDVYNQFYGKDYIVKDIIMNSDLIYVIFIESSSITGDYKSTKAIIFTKEFYDRTNFVDPLKIYENNEE